MAIPEYIRKVPRPVNTVVVDNGKDGPNRYAVRERAGTKYIRDGNPQPKNGKVIGHIFDGAYIPLMEKQPHPDRTCYRMGQPHLRNPFRPISWLTFWMSIPQRTHAL